MMINSRLFIGCLMLVASLSPVSGQCSTCLEKRCYENGECIIGCMPGYFNIYCNEACPSTCLNKRCHLHIIDGSVTCTDGCEPGYCGASCEDHCPGDCVTCDRQCESCNVTLCPERRYGADCSRVCSERYGKCDRETGQCIICRRGYYGDECKQECPTCFTRAETIYDECLSGCDICISKGICPAGFRGDACELPCSPGCDNPEHVCNRATGECSAGCVSGYHGLTCNYTCNEHCLSGRCNKATGECSDGCVSGYHGLTCNYTCDSFCEGGVCNQHDGVCTSGCISGYGSNLDICEKYDNEGSHTPVAIAVPITVICLLAGMVTAAVIWRRRRSRRPNTLLTAHAEKGTNGTDVVEPLLKYKKEDDSQQLPEEVQHLKTRTREEIELYTTGMIRVSAVDDVLDKLKAGQRWVTITGNAGDGKTTLGYLVLKEFLHQKVNVFKVYKPEDYEQIEKIKEDRVIMFDDRFGAFLADQHLIKSWLDVIRKFLSFSENDQQNNHVIFISRKNVVNESKIYLGQYTEKMFDPKCVVDLSVRKEKDLDERLKILDYHLQHENVTVNLELKKKVSNKDMAHGFPHCCKMYSKLRSNRYDVDIEDFFKSPLKFLDMTTKVLYKDNCKDLFQLMIKNDGKFDVFTIGDEYKRQKLLQVEKEQEGSYITVWRNGTCQFAHPSVYESVLNVINNIDPLYCVQYATLSVIRQKMIISTSDEKDKSRSPCYIVVKPNPTVLKALAGRFREKILKGNYSVFEHRLCQSKEFCEALVSCCVTTDESEDGRQFINRPGQGGDTMLWTALKCGGMAAVQTLVRKAKADVTIQDERGRTPLQYLCQLKHSASDDQQHHLHMETIQVIITEGRANVNVYDQHGQTPLHYICELKTNTDNQHHVHMETIQVIITEGRGDINTCNQYGQTPLHYLFKYSTFTAEEIQWITTKGQGDLNQCEQHKSTPLHYLCANSSLQLDTVDLVIKEGKGDFNKGDEHGTTPFHYLCQNGKVELDVVLQIVNTAKGDINKQDDSGITPLHVLCKGSLPIENILALIQQGNKADKYGNSPLHYLSRRRGINAEELQQQLEHLPELTMEKENNLGYTPLNYLTDQDDRLPWTDGMIARSAADLVLCRLKHGEDWIYVLGRAMILNSERVHKELQVEDFGRVLTNLEQSGRRNSPGPFSRLWGTCSSPVPVPPSPSPLSNPPSYWETSSTLTRRKRSYRLLEMGLIQGRSNMYEGLCVSHLPNSVCVSVMDDCHPDRFCIQVLRRAQEDSERHQVGDCVSLSLPTPGVEFTLTFGLVLDVGRGRVGFIDVERGQLLCKVDLQMKEEVFPMFYVYPDNNYCATKMRLISGREICVTDKKKHLIQQALSD